MNTPRVHTNVEGYLEAPETGGPVELIVDLGTLSESELKYKVNDLGGDYIRELSFELHLVSLPTENLESFCETTGIETIEANEGVEEYDSGKLKSRPALNL